MTEPYHGTPITPNALLEMLGARRYCVSYYRPDQIEIVAAIALRVMLDNGAFSAWRKGIVLDSAYWRGFFDFVALWLPRCPLGSWFVIPDVIDAGTQEQDALIRECPAELLAHGAPVWHMDEPIYRLLALIERFPRVCIGSTAEFRVVGSPAWRARMDEAWSEIDATFKAVPNVHMLRGMQCLFPSFAYPFTTVDSADLGRNHFALSRRYGREHIEWLLRAKADRWEALGAARPLARWGRGQLMLPGIAA